MYGGGTLNRLSRFALAAGLPLIAILAFALAAHRGETLPDRGWSLLSAYLDLVANSGQSVRVVQTVPASRPSNFRRELSAYSLGYGLYYQTSSVVQSRPEATYAPDPLATLYPRDASTPAVTYYPAGSGSRGRALHYPPDYATCVLIERDSKYEVVILAEHHDTWNADWVLHTSTLSPEKLIETLGCDLDLLQ